MRITVEYLSHIRDAAGIDEEPIETDTATIAGALRAVAEAHAPAMPPLLLDEAGLPHPWLMLTINDAMTRDPAAPLREGDRLTIAVPISGG